MCPISSLPKMQFISHHDHLNLVGVREVPLILVVAQVGRRVVPLEALKVVRLEVLKAAPLEEVLKLSLIHI